MKPGTMALGVSLAVGQKTAEVRNRAPTDDVAGLRLAKNNESKRID